MSQTWPPLALMAHLYTRWGRLLQPSASWKKAPQQIEPSSSFLCSGLLSLVLAQNQQPVQPLDQKFQADLECSHSALVSAQKLHGVLDVLHFAQISESVHGEISQILIYVSWMKNVLTCVSW